MHKAEPYIGRCIYRLRYFLKFIFTILAGSWAWPSSVPVCWSALSKLINHFINVFILFILNRIMNTWMILVKLFRVTNFYHQLSKVITYIYFRGGIHPRKSEIILISDYSSWSLLAKGCLAFPNIWEHFPKLNKARLRVA